MSALDDRRRLEELYLPPADEFVLVDVPDLQFVMIDGEGNPSGEAFAQASRWLFSVVFPIKRVAKERMGKSFGTARGDAAQSEARAVRRRDECADHACRPQ